MYKAEFPFEDSAAMREKVAQSCIFTTSNHTTQFAVCVRMKAFGLKFAHVCLEIYRLVQKSGGDSKVISEGKGTRYGLGW